MSVCESGAKGVLGLATCPSSPPAHNAAGGEPRHRVYRVCRPRFGAEVSFTRLIGNRPEPIPQRLTGCRPGTRSVPRAVRT